MTAELIRHPGPWTEDDYFALGESNDRIELLDGSLVVSPAGSGPHQQFARRAVFETSEVELVAEVVPPGNAAMDRVVKMQLYALAGIPWYLLAQTSPPELRLYRLSGDHYVEHAVAADGDPLYLTEPFAVVLDATQLLRTPRGA